ncbi:uncharacterized protein [Salvelinus alpinus]|uniref:uncharacterized protein n=1 Tax=Salvelinus alpinus TaxID=8036 RepID=UPI0039FDC3E4
MRSAQEFALKFRTASAGWNDRALIDHYRCSLREDVCREMFCRDQLLYLSIWLDNLLATRGRPDRGLSVPSPSTTAPTPMELGGAALRATRGGAIPCTICGHGGHNAGRCWGVWESRQRHSRVTPVKNFSECKKFFLEGTTPNLPGILVGGEVQNQNRNRYKPICQNYKNTYRFATLYDTTNRIPVFSAYNFTGPDPGIKDEVCKLSRSWRIEQQLKNNNRKTLHLQSEVKKLNNNKDIVNQAANADYKNNSRGLQKGHLFPCSHAPDDDTKRSTYTLTNAVPQVGSFNGGRWRVVEGNVRDALVSNCKINNKRKAYVVTGAVPNNNNNKLNNRVNIPDLLWTAFCCETSEKDKWVAGAYWGENKEDNGNILTLVTLGKLEVKLKKSYNGNVKVFHDKCPRNVNVQQVKRGREESGEEDNMSEKKRRRIKMKRASMELKECDEEDECDCDCDEK